MKSTTANPKKQTTPVVKAKPKKATTVRVPKAPTNIKPHINSVCGLVDPWCEHARGAKYPDESSARTLPFTIQYSQTLSTNAAGSLAFIFVPRIASDSGQINTATVTAVDVATSGLNFDATIVAPLAGVQKYRIVSAGVRIKRISPDLTTSGMLYVRSYAYPEFANLNIYDIDNFNCSQIVNIPLVNVKDSTFVSEHSSQMPQTFYNLSSGAAATFTGAGFNNMTIGVIGAPASTPVLFVEYIMHVEYMFDDSSPLALAATPPPVPNPVITNASRAITSQGSHFFSDSVAILGDFIRRKATNYLATALGSSPNPYAKLAGGALSIAMVD